MDTGGLLETLLAALKTGRGYFVWQDGDGEEYVLISRREFDPAHHSSSAELQLDLLQEPTLASTPARGWSADDMLDKINHDLALYQLQRDEETDSIETIEDDSIQPLPPVGGKKVKFEPLRGDLPPDLQD